MNQLFFSSTISVLNFINIVSLLELASTGLVCFFFLPPLLISSSTLFTISFGYILIPMSAFTHRPRDTASMKKILKPRVNNPPNESGRNKTKKNLSNDNKIIKPCSKPEDESRYREQKFKPHTHTHARAAQSFNFTSVICSFFCLIC